jgi:hypothetical protein
MSQSPSNQVVTLSATPNTAQAVTAPQYYERIIVTNESTGDVYVSTNGFASRHCGGQLRRRGTAGYTDGLELNFWCVPCCASTIPR